VTRHLAIVGCTASGKSALALEIARSCDDVELVSLDSMQVYRGMDIGTAKPTAAERAEVVHHLVDVADPACEWSVRATQRAALAAISDIEARGRRAILVGGTGLYVRAVVDGLDVPARDLDRRATLESETASDAGLAHAYARLRELDAAAAARIDPGNRRRIVRALEVLELTGRPFSSFGPGLDRYDAPVIDVTMVGVWLPREELARRIDRRVTQMRDQGLVAEVAGLVDRPGGLARTAVQAIGYRELAAHLAGEIPGAGEAFALVATRTKRFARRQRMWFRRDPRIRWVGASGNPGQLAPLVVALWDRTALRPVPERGT
jgi:tRNA dimethylallyltransferase